MLTGFWVLVAATQGTPQSLPPMGAQAGSPYCGAMRGALHGRGFRIPRQDHAKPAPAEGPDSRLGEGTQDTFSRRARGCQETPTP